MSAPKEDISARAKRPLMSRARGTRRSDWPPWAVRPGGPVGVMVLMYVTVGAKWSTDKGQFHGYSVIRFGTGGGLECGGARETEMQRR